VKASEMKLGNKSICGLLFIYNDLLRKSKVLPHESTSDFKA
jgi:hypothetical protein